MDGLAEGSRAPHRHPNATSVAVVEAVLRAKARRPQYGPAKLQPGPQAPPEIAKAWPAPSTIGGILKRHGLVSARRRRRRVLPWTQPFHHCTGPNSVWSTDFKGWFRTGNGRRCDPLTISDAFSRMLLCCEVVARPDYPHVRSAMERTFREYGLPEAIRSDNGSPFASVGAGGLSPLAVWWVKLGILPERIEPGHPEQNGRHERLHLTLKEATAKPPAPTLAAQKARFAAFRAEYNQERPHQALGQVPPATLYVPSPRAYPGRIEDPRYPEWALVRRVRSNGEIKWKGELLFISEALVGEVVGITELDNAWLVSFGPIALGLLRPGQHRLERLPACIPTGPWVVLSFTMMGDT
jgi:transposase InsO family protein